jgi:uncharacterized repeat protein (TIGR03803 family)
MFIDRCFAVRIAGAGLTLSLLLGATPMQAGATAHVQKIPPATAPAPGTIATLHTFAGPDGANPAGTLLVGLGSGGATLYGTTPSGGSATVGDIFSVTYTGAHFADLVNFTGANGAAPAGGLDSLVNPIALGPLFGVTSTGGKYGFGTIYGALPNGAQTVLYSFTGNADGANPVGELVANGGALYGVTSAGASGFGTVFRYSSHGLQTLHTFTGGNDGGTPGAGLALRIVIPSNAVGARAATLQGNTIAASRAPGSYVDPALYGTTSNYGAGGTGNGTIFKITPTGKFTTLFTFTDCVAGTGCSPVAPGSVPLAALTSDFNGNLFGTTSTGGSAGLGEVFEYSATGAFSVVHDFGVDASSNPTTGANPASPVTVAYNGSLYGTTVSGSLLGLGVVYKISPGTGFSVLYAFGTAPTDGAAPASRLVDGFNGTLYGTTSAGGVNGFGTVFAIGE